MILREDGIVAIPTETVYGLAARCTSETAIKAVFAQKQRPATNPLIIHVASYDAVSEWAETSPTSEALAAHFWPGPLTLVLPSTGAVAPSVTAGQSTVAVRMPDHPIALQIIKAAGEPLAAPSANISGKPSPTTVEHVIADHGDTIPVVSSHSGMALALM